MVKVHMIPTWSMPKDNNLLYKLEYSDEKLKNMGERNYWIRIHEPVLKQSIHTFLFRMEERIVSMTDIERSQ